MNILFLGDSPERQKKFRSHVPSATIVATAQEAIANLAAQGWDTVLLDHDLGGTENAPSDKHSGMEVVRWVALHKPAVREFIVHSLNHQAAREMVAILRSSGYVAWAVPYTTFNGSLT